MDPTVLIIIGIVVVLVVFVIAIYNGLVQRRLRIDEAFAQIEVQLKRRQDLIPNLVNAVKGYMGFEQKVLTDVTNARAAAVAAGAQGPAQQASAENALTGTLRSLFAVVENYPELKANQNVLELQEQLTTTENQIRFSRQHYNATVLDYNTAIATIPNVLIAGPLGLHQARVLRRRARGVRHVPTVDLSLSYRSPVPREGPWLARPSHQQISANRRNSILLAVVVVVLLGALGFTVGYAMTGEPAGGRVRPRSARCSSAGWSRSGPTSPATRSSWRVRAPRRSTRARAPQLMNVVREMAIAANVPMPKVYLIDDTAPERVRHGPRPEARLGRDHDRPAREARPRGAPGRDRPRAVPRPQPRHPVLAVVGVMVGAIALLADFFLRFTFWGGVGGRSRSNRDGGGGAQIVVMIIAIVLAILAPLFSRFVQLAVSREREYLADASTSS